MDRTASFAVGVRHTIDKESISAVVRQVAEKFNPQKIVLFGSYAYGIPRPGSDVDLLVVMDTSLREVEQAIQICQNIQYYFGLDLLVRTPSTLGERIKLGDPFLTEILNKGKVVYERPFSICIEAQ